MSNTINASDIKKIQFYQMPKVFFGDTKYQEMKSESKLAYMLLRDLLPLSIQNNWVNEEREVFVKLSRRKLMSLLNIKGTQKITQVMKELVDYELIIYKRIGLSKCNEIYILQPDTTDNDDPVDKIDPPKPTASKKDETEISDNEKTTPTEMLKTDSHKCDKQTHIKTNSIKTNYTKTNINQSINPEEGVEDFEELYDHFNKQLHTDYLVQQYDDEMVGEIINNICDMHMNKSTHIRGQAMPRSVIRSVLAKLKMHHIEHVIDKFLEAAGQYEIRHTKGYLQTLIYNSIFEAGSRIRGQVRYDMGY